METNHVTNFPVVQDFFPVGIECLSEKTPYPVDLFLRVNGTYYLFKRKEEMRHKEAIELLRSKDASTIYIRAEDLQLFEDVFLDHLPQTLLQTHINAQASVLKTAGQQVIQSVFTQPADLKRSINNAQKWVNQVFLSLAANPTLLYQMLALLNHDEYTYNHSLGVSLYAVTLALETKSFNPKQIESIGLAALVHDIGKREIPLSILNKPGPLTEDEWKIMKQHPTKGAHLLKDWAGQNITTKSMVIDIVLGHHEHLDGTGYPQGLKGTNISLAQRIVTISDIFSALTTDRPYSKAMSTFQAIKLLREKFATKIDQRLLKMQIKLMGGSLEGL